MKPRFTKELRSHARRDGTSDRYWVVLDREQKGFMVLKISASYPGAETLAGDYALKMNSLTGRNSNEHSRINHPPGSHQPSRAHSDPRRRLQDW